LGNSSVQANSDIPVAQDIAQQLPNASVNRPILRIGSEGEAVSELQAVLKLLGYYTDTVDGIYLESTAVAVSRFQQAAGLPVDGIAGSATWNRLFPSTALTQTLPATASSNATSSFPVPSTISDRPATIPASFPTSANSQSAVVTLPILRKGMEGSAVVQLQERLKTLGFFTTSVDGVFGDATQAAVKAAQQNFQLEPDGIVGPATWSALLR
jgi:peptidoglycan hydrolase-like protein with peptidoglycan-binding domain